MIVPIIGFWASDVRVTLGLLALQLMLWAILRIPPGEFSQLRRVRRLTVILLLVFSLFHSEPEITLLVLGNWSLGFSPAGFIAGLLVIAKLLIMLLAAQIVQYSTPAKDMIAGMRTLGMSKDSAMIMVSLMELISGEHGHGRGEGRGHGRGKSRGPGKDHKEGGPPVILKSILKGDLNPVYQRIERQRDRISAQFSDNDLAGIASFSALIILVRFIKIAPGLPIAPGHKNVLIIPFFIVGSHSAQGSWAGAKIGFFSGFIHFMSGFGKYGPLGILQFVLLGAVIDVLLAVFRNPFNLFICGLIGIIAGLFRVISEIIIALILDVPVEFYLFYLPFIAAHCVFGAISAPITKQMLQRFSKP